MQTLSQYTLNISRPSFTYSVKQWTQVSPIYTWMLLVHQINKCTQHILDFSFSSLQWLHLSGFHLVSFQTPPVPFSSNSQRRERFSFLVHTFILIMSTDMLRLFLIPTSSDPSKVGCVFRCHCCIKVKKKLCSHDSPPSDELSWSYNNCNLSGMIACKMRRNSV